MQSFSAPVLNTGAKAAPIEALAKLFAVPN
jgi:hypothetical protein